MDANWEKSDRGRYKAQVRIFVVRHGQTDWNLAGRAQGHTDVPVNRLGLWQSARVAMRLVDERPELVMTSDLSRCRQIADRVGEVAGVPVEADTRLRERTFGDLEGLSFEELRSWHEQHRPPHQDPHDLRPPNGESPHDVWMRMEQMAREILRKNRTVAVITHGMAGSLLIGRLLGGSIATGRAFRLENAALTELRCHTDGHLVLVRYNDASHLNTPMESLSGEPARP